MKNIEFTITCATTSSIIIANITYQDMEFNCNCKVNQDYVIPSKTRDFFNHHHANIEFPDPYMVLELSQ